MGEIGRNNNSPNIPADAGRLERFQINLTFKLAHSTRNFGACTFDWTSLLETFYSANR
jgi:hypothetical protein